MIDNANKNDIEKLEALLEEKFKEYPKLQNIKNEIFINEKQSLNTAFQKHSNENSFYYEIRNMILDRAKMRADAVIATAEHEMALEKNKQKSKEAIEASKIAFKSRIKRLEQELTTKMKNYKFDSKFQHVEDEKESNAEVKKWINGIKPIVDGIEERQIISRDKSKIDSMFKIKFSKKLALKMVSIDRKLANVLNELLNKEYVVSKNNTVLKKLRKFFGIQNPDDVIIDTVTNQDFLRRTIHTGRVTDSYRAHKNSKKAN